MRSLGGPLQAKALACEQFQPRALYNEQIPPVEEREVSGNGWTVSSSSLDSKPQDMAKRMKRPRWLSVPEISPVPSSTTFSIHIFSSSGSSGQRPSMAAMGLGKGLGKNR